jgi:hypothetical protein
MTLLYADDIARALEVDEDTVFEMARTMKLPFAISTAPPRRLFIAASELQIWREAMRGASDA